MTPRLSAIALPTVRIEIARCLHDTLEERPLAIVIARQDGAVKDETTLLGNTRLDEVSHEAYALGVRRGQTIAAARAKTADLAVRVVHVDAVKGALESLAEMALAFGARTFFEVGGSLGDVVWCDVTGCAHLASSKKDPLGECTLAARLAEKVRAMGHACRVAIAEGPRIAAAVARFAPAKNLGPLIIPTGKGAIALHRLPLAALALDRETHAWLTKLGVRTAGDLARLPRRSVGMRLGKDAARVLRLLEGDDRERLAPYVPPEVPEEKVELEYGIEVADALVFVAKRLADRLAPRLAGRCKKTRRLELELRLDRAVLRDPGEDSRPVLTLELPSALASAEDMLRVLRVRIESYVIPAPVLEVRLRAKELVTSEGELLDLLVPEARAERALPRLGAELFAELGEGRVGTLALCDTWVPEERVHLVPLSFPKHELPPRGRQALLSGAPEPSRFLRAGLPYRERHSLRLLERLEAVHWWKTGLTFRNFLAAWSEDKRSMAWIEVDSEVGEPRLRGWMD